MFTFVALLLLLFVRQATAASGEPPLPDLGAAYPLNLQDAVTRHPLAPELKGKVVLLSFIAETCRESCPVIESRFAAVQRLLRRNGDLGTRIHLVLVTVDPLEDTPAHLRTLAKKTGATSGVFHFASGSYVAVQRVLKAYGITVTFHGNSREDPDHTVAIYLLDPKMRIRYDFGLYYPPPLIARIAETLARESSE